MVLSTHVKVKQGTVIGGEGILPNGSKYYYFKGIPYAVPPVGALRFKAPVPLEVFSAPELLCTKDRARSLQKDKVTGDVIGSEDCLFLNVYTPKKTDAILPVMVYIHGGEFRTGSGAVYDPFYLLQEEVVVVTINYRLGPLGFLSLPEANIPGNAGLKDQRLALQWVKENISQFNGNPNNVTLFGHSSGSVCVHLHVLSENSRNLFHKAIVQSGTGNMQLVIEKQPSCKATNLAHAMGCTSGDPLVIGDFLRNVTDLSGFTIPSLSESNLDEIIRDRSLPATPVIEKNSPDAVVARSPLESMNDENTIDIPLMLGYTSAEAIIYLPSFENIEEYNDLRKFIPIGIDLKMENKRSQEFADEVREFYFKGEKVSNATLSVFTDLLGDMSFIVDTNLAAEIHSKKQHKSPLFFYRFDFEGALNLYRNRIPQAKDIRGASHADEVFYIFQTPNAPEPWESATERMVKIMCKLWTNFAKYGNPTPERKEETIVDCIWEPVRKIGDKDEPTLNTFIIDERSKMLENPIVERIAFWKHLREKYN